MSMVLDNNPTGFTSTRVEGDTRYLPRELLDNQPRTMEGDIWAYGCICLRVSVPPLYHRHYGLLCSTSPDSLPKTAVWFFSQWQRNTGTHQKEGTPSHVWSSELTPPLGRSDAWMLGTQSLFESYDKRPYGYDANQTLLTVFASPLNFHMYTSDLYQAFRTCLSCLEKFQKPVPYMPRRTRNRASAPRRCRFRWLNYLKHKHVQMCQTNSGCVINPSWAAREEILSPKYLIV